MGQVLTGGAGGGGGVVLNSLVDPKEKPAYIANQVCGSGIRSCTVFQSIKSGDSKIIIARKYVFTPAIHLRNGKKLGETELPDTMIKDTGMLFMVTIWDYSGKCSLKLHDKRSTR